MPKSAYKCNENLCFFKILICDLPLFTKNKICTKQIIMNHNNSEEVIQHKNKKREDILDISKKQRHVTSVVNHTIFFFIKVEN